jgi:ankyrin repeat protein
MVPRHPPPTRTLRARPDLVQLKRQARELRAAFAAGRADAIAEVRTHCHGADPRSFALHDAQLVLARAYGFASWPRLKAYVDGVTVRRLVAAVRAGDLPAVRATLARRPELVHLDVAEHDEHRALHHAVLERQPEIVRVLMRHGADARKGIYPHRDATSALILASERGYRDIVAIILEEEARRSPAPSAPADLPAPADGTLRAAVASGDVGWLQARLAEGAPGTPGLVTYAVTANRPEVLALLLELGFDPDDRERVEGLEEVVQSWGGPLRACAISGRHAMTELLLARGATPNTNVYAASSAMYEAHARDDREMIRLLEGHGGVVDVMTVGFLGSTDHAERMFREEAAGRLPDGTVPAGQGLAEAMLFCAADHGHVGLVRIALDRLEWSRDDPRWHGMLVRPFGDHGPADRERYLTCFRLMLARTDANVSGSFGRTLLHDVSAAWPRAPLGPEERLDFATTLLDAGGRLDVRDDLLKSTPLGWACRWGRLELVELFLARGADAVEPDAEPWATPRAWAEKMDRRDVLELLRRGR